jgi:hypothetical protein
MEHASAFRSPSAAPFDFTAHMQRLCDDIVARLPTELGHVDMNRVAVSFRQTRNAGPFGLYATLTPLRFAGGASEVVRRGRTWRAPRVLGPTGSELLYILNFYLPRFLDLDLPQKLLTTLHELWHIGPRFDGDLRRFNGRCYAHSGSRRQFDRIAEGLVQRWLATGPHESLYDFLRLDFTGLHARHGRIVGMRVRTPRLIRAG